MLFDETTAREISYRAMRLLERARLDDGPTPAPEASEPTSRLERWCAVSRLGTREDLRRRLEAERLDPERFARLLAADTAEGARRLAYSADWVARLEAAYEIEDETPLRVGGAAARSPLLPFLALTKPLLAAAHARIARAASATETAAPGSLDVASVTASLFEPLPAKAIAATSRTLALELHVARLEERLAGETPEARFASFVDWLGTREAARELFAEYPVLARLLVEECDRSVTIADEFLGRFAADRGQIVTEIFGGRDPGPLASVSADAGDTHRGGRSVFVASFASGRRVVYKPRGGGLDRHFAGLVAWANGTGLVPDLRVPLVLDRETHSWAEFVEALPCASQKEVQRFYERQGALLALLYVLNAVDFHYENVIASGAYPVLVDLEALFHPAFSPEQGERVPAARAASVRMMRSVVRTGLLPWRVARSPEHGGLEVGGLADVAGQLSPEAIAMWRETGTDRLTLARERRPVPGADNVPVLSGAKVSALDFGDRLVAGFDQMYQLLTARKDEVLAKGGPLAAFRDDENRLILRATRTYAILLAESKHPNLLRDALERELHFDRLWAACRPEGFWARVVPAELEDLRSGDVPLFTARPGSRSIFTASGREIPDALSEPPIRESERRLAKLSEEDRAWQSQIIVTSLATLRRGTHATHTGGYGWGRELAASEPLRVAEAVGETLASRAVFGETDVTWIDLVPDAFDCWNLEAMPLDLYSGVAGALLFFTYLRAYSRSERGREMEDRSIAALRLASRESWLGSLKLGAFTGLGGAVYALTHAAEVRREPALFDLAGQFAEAILEGARRDSEFDVVAGAAGAIVPLLTLARLAGSAETRSAAERAALACGDRLLESASESPRGLVWASKIPSIAPLSGFSHGTAGIGWALARLARASGSPRYARAADRAFDYERSVFLEDERNWPDLREEGRPGSRSMTAWCYGAPGLALALMDANKTSGPDRELFDAALETTAEHGFGLNHSLCHGDLGNLDVLIEAERRGWLTHGTSRLKAAEVFAAAARSGWRSGSPGSAPSLGLMSGLLGVGYAMLRLATGGEAPSVLCLAAPRRAGAPRRGAGGGRGRRALSDVTGGVR